MEMSVHAHVYLMGCVSVKSSSRRHNLLACSHTSFSCWRELQELVTALEISKLPDLKMGRSPGEIKKIPLLQPRPSQITILNLDADMCGHTVRVPWSNHQEVLEDTHVSRSALTFYATFSWPFGSRLRELRSTEKADNKRRKQETEPVSHQLRTTGAKSAKSTFSRSFPSCKP